MWLRFPFFHHMTPRHWVVESQRFETTRLSWNVGNLMPSDAASYLTVNFKVHESVHGKSIPIYIQQDATLHSLFISGNCSTYFEWYLYPSSGALTTISTAFGICHTVTVTVWQIPDVVDTVVYAPDDGWKYHPKYVEQFPDINKLCRVASCWIYIGILQLQRPYTLTLWESSHQKRRNRAFDFQRMLRAFPLWDEANGSQDVVR
jgi:hypothetical protein